MITEETQLFCCFMLFIGSAYSLGGDAFGAMMDEKGDAILKYVVSVFPELWILFDSVR